MCRPIHLGPEEGHGCTWFDSGAARTSRNRNGHESAVGGKVEQLSAILSPSHPEQEPGFITSFRHVGLLRETLEAIDNARIAVEHGIPHEMLLLDLYAALGPLDAITGATTADDILNRIFSTFCIGK